MQRQYDTHYAISDKAVIFDRYGAIIFAYIRVHTSCSEDAEDLTLEVFMAAYEHDNLSALNSGAEQLAWLKRVARNKLIDHYRKTQRRPTVTLNQFTETMMDEKISPDELILQREAHGELHEYVRQLPSFQQQLLRLRYGEGLRCSEIASLVNKSEIAVRQILSRTIKQLRSMYQDQPMGKGEGA